MKTALTGVAGMLAGELCEFYKITLRTGTVLAFSTFDVDLDWDGHTFLSAFPIERDDITTARGIEVNDVGVTFYPNGFEVGGTPLQAFAANGGLKWAKIVIYRAKSSRVTHLYEGLIVNPQANREKLTLTCKPTTYLLNIDMPRNKILPGCLNTVYDAACGLNRNDWGVSGTAQSGSSKMQINTAFSQADQYFSRGKVVFVDGDNAGASRFINGYAGGILYLNQPLPHTPAIGDAIIAYPGCPGTKDVCVGRFNNLANARMFPYKPLSTTSI